MARNSDFKFKQFTVGFSHTAMRVGTDGVLLGAWCPVQRASRVLDVGTGCGVIALQVAQRNPRAHILAIDIDAGAIADAARNFAASPWSDRLEARQADFNELDCACGSFDLIVSNPPFFTGGIQPPEPPRGVARHTVALSYKQLLAGAKRLLACDGVLAMITPAAAHKEVLECCVSNDFYISRIAEVSTIAGQPAKRLLWAMTLASCSLQRTQLAIENADHTFTQEYTALCRDFYLKM